MKRIISAVLILFLTLPCFASNLLQQNDELKYVQKNGMFPTPIYYKKDYLVREDYYGYLHGKNSVYGYIINTLEDISKSNIPHKDLNIKYLNLAKTKIETIVKLKNNDIDNNMRLNAVNKKIVIDDADYIKLSYETKQIMIMCNIGMFD